MSADVDQARLMAERIARRMSQSDGDRQAADETGGAGDARSELAAIHASLEELQKKLVHIESHLAREGQSQSEEKEGASEERSGKAPLLNESSAPASRGAHSPWLSGMYVPATAHPSQERFGVDEAAISELVDYFEKEKVCELEPGGKPCDHCAMCSSRGF